MGKACGSYRCAGRTGQVVQVVMVVTMEIWLRHRVWISLCPEAVSLCFGPALCSRRQQAQGNVWSGVGAGHAA